MFQVSCFSLNNNHLLNLAFPGGSDGKKSAHNAGYPAQILPTMWDIQLRSLGWEDSLEKGMATTPVFLPGESHGQKSLAGHSLWGCKRVRQD